MITIMAIKIMPRGKAAPKVQSILTEYGCIIKTRLGLHEATDDSCSQTGLILLNLIGDDKEQINSLHDDLNDIDGVVAKILEL